MADNGAHQDAVSAKNVEEEFVHKVSWVPVSFRHLVPQP